MLLAYSLRPKRNYSTTEWEDFAIVYALQKFCHYLLATHFIVIIDHYALKYLLNKPQVAGKVWRWLLLFQEFNFDLLLRPRKNHVLAHHLSH